MYTGLFTSLTTSTDPNHRPKESYIAVARRHSHRCWCTARGMEKDVTTTIPSRKRSACTPSAGTAKTTPHVAARDSGFAPSPRRHWPHSLAPSSEATSLSLPRTARALRRQRYASREGGVSARAPFIHPLLRGDVDPVGGATPVDRQEPRRPTCSMGEAFGRLRSRAQQEIALHSAGLGRGSPAVDGLDLRAVGRAEVSGALRRGGRGTAARSPAGTPPNTAQLADGVLRAQAGAASACRALTGETSPPRPPAHRRSEGCSAGIHRSSGRHQRRP